MPMINVFFLFLTIQLLAFSTIRTYNTDNKKSEDSKDLMSIESSLYYFVCLVLLLQILQKSIVTLAIIYKFGGYKEKEVKEVDTSRMGH